MVGGAKMIPCGHPGPACLFARAVEPCMVLTKRLGWVAGLALWQWHGDARLLCLCEQKLLKSVFKLINVIFSGLDHGSEGLYEFLATGVPAPNCFAALHPVRVHRGGVGVAVGACAGRQGCRRTHVQADDQMGVVQLGGTARRVIRDLEVCQQGKRGLICDDVIYCGATRWTSKGMSLLSRAPI